MIKKLLIFIILMISYQENIFSQITEKSSLNAFVSVGPSLYFNNIEVNKESVNTIGYASSLKLMWKSKYMLSLGLHTGIRKIYNINIIQKNSETTIDLYSIPLQLIIMMDLNKNLYTSVGTGPSYLWSNINIRNTQELSTSLVSLADVILNFGYKKKLNNHMYLTGELDFYHSSATFENNFSVLIGVKYKL